MIEYIIRNKEWIFSGVGVVALGTLITLARILLNRKSKNKTQSEITMPNEIRRLRHSLIDYCKTPKSRPLSIAVFGEQSSQRTNKLTELFTATLTNNLKAYYFDVNCFSDATQLIEHLIQICEERQYGVIPLVFWKNFDCELSGTSLGYLQFFLSPMYGVFLYKGHTYEIGQSIFVFISGFHRNPKELLQSNKKESKYNKMSDFMSRIDYVLSAID